LVEEGAAAEGLFGFFVVVVEGGAEGRYGLVKVVWFGCRDVPVCG
jgi:hypothetical protein